MFDEAIDRQADAVEAGVQSQTPTGRWSAPRLNAFARAVDQAFALLDPAAEPTVLAELPRPGQPMALPAGLAERYLALRDACDSYYEQMEASGEDAEPHELPDLASLTDDSTLALATAALARVVKDRGFAKWLKQPRAETPAPQDQAAPAQQAPLTGDLAVLFGEG